MLSDSLYLFACLTIIAYSVTGNKIFSRIFVSLVIIGFGTILFLGV